MRYDGRTKSDRAGHPFTAANGSRLSRPIGFELWDGSRKVAEERRRVALLQPVVTKAISTHYVTPTSFRHGPSDWRRYTGQRVSELKPNRYVSALMAAYVAVANGRAPEFHSLIYRRAGLVIRYSRLLMPLSNRGLDADTIWAVTNYGEGVSACAPGWVTAMISDLDI